MQELPFNILTYVSSVRWSSKLITSQKITDLMHRNLLSWYEDDLDIVKDMVYNAAELENAQGRSGLCTCTCSPTVTRFMALNEYESLLASLSIQEEALKA